MKMIYLIIGLVLLVGIFFFLISCKNNSKPIVETNQQSENKTKFEPNKPTNNPYENLRNMALATTPEQLNLKLHNNKTKVYGVVVDWNTGEGIATFAIFQTGDASMYTSTGGGVIGGGKHENVKNAAVNFINKAQNYLSKATKTETTPLPGNNIVKFYLLTNKGKFVAQEQMENFENNSSDLLDLFEEANKVVTELRQTADMN